jgi:hypothetical protein
LLVIDDDGRTYITSVNFLLGLINGKSKHDFILLSRLPQNNSDSRFKKSPVYDPDGVFQGDAAKTLELTTSNDALSVKAQKEKQEKKSFEDKNVW